MRRADLKKHYVYKKSIFTIAKTNKVCFDKNYFINLFDEFFVRSLDTDPSSPNPGQRQKVKSNFYLHTSMWCLKRFYEGLKALRKNLNKFLFQYNFPKCTG